MWTFHTKFAVDSDLPSVFPQWRQKKKPVRMKAEKAFFIIFVHFLLEETKLDQELYTIETVNVLTRGFFDLCGAVRQSPDLFILCLFLLIFSLSGVNKYDTFKD